MAKFLSPSEIISQNSFCIISILIRKNLPRLWFVALKLRSVPFFLFINDELKIQTPIHFAEI